MVDRLHRIRGVLERQRLERYGVHVLLIGSGELHGGVHGRRRLFQHRPEPAHVADKILSLRLGLELAPPGGMLNPQGGVEHLR